jgi:hypothetical protein
MWFDQLASTPMSMGFKSSFCCLDAAQLGGDPRRGGAAFGVP